MEHILDNKPWTGEDIQQSWGFSRQRKHQNKPLYWCIPSKSTQNLGKEFWEHIRLQLSSCATYNVTNHTLHISCSQNGIAPNTYWPLWKLYVSPRLRKRLVGCQAVPPSDHLLRVTTAQCKQPRSWCEYRVDNMGVSINGGTPKWMVLNGNSY